MARARVCTIQQSQNKHRVKYYLPAIYLLPRYITSYSEPVYTLEFLQHVRLVPFLSYSVQMCYIFSTAPSLSLSLSLFQNMLHFVLHRPGRENEVYRTKNKLLAGTSALSLIIRNASANRGELRQIICHL